MLLRAQFWTETTYLPLVTEEFINRNIFPPGYLLPVVFFSLIGIISYRWLGEDVLFCGDSFGS